MVAGKDFTGSRNQNIYGGIGDWTSGEKTHRPVEK